MHCEKKPDFLFGNGKVFQQKLMGLWRSLKYPHIFHSDDLIKEWCKSISGKNSSEHLPTSIGQNGLEQAFARNGSEDLQTVWTSGWLGILVW